MNDSWPIEAEGISPCCSRALKLAREPGTSPEMIPDAFECPHCGSLLRLSRTQPKEFELAAPCDVCDLNGIPTEGPLCRHCGRCEIDCDGMEYPEDMPQAHEFEPAPTGSMG
jgi:hypothetical protein